MKKHIADLERVNLALAAELQQTKARLEREVEQSRALWPEVLDESGDFSRN
jgi:hypothetical protein